MSTPTPAKWRLTHRNPIVSVFRIGRVVVACSVIVTLATLVSRDALHTLARPIGIGAVLYIALVWPKVVRWRRLLTLCGVHLSARAAWRYYLSGLALGAVTPGRIGELARVAGPVRLGHSWRPVAAVTLADRLFDVSGLAAAAALLLFGWRGGYNWDWQGTSAQHQGLVVALYVLGGALLLALVVPLCTLWLLARAGPNIRNPPDRIDPAIRSDTGTTLVISGALSALSIGLLVVVGVQLLHAAGAHGPIWLLAGAVACGNLASLLPLSVGGLGTREVAMLTLLTTAGGGANVEVLALYSLGFHAVFTGMPWLIWAALALSANTEKATSLATRKSAGGGAAWYSPTRT